MSNALQALLGAKPASEITENISIKRLGTDFVIKALTGDDIDKLREQATYPVKEGKKTVQKVNEDEAARLLIVKATVEPNFADKQLVEHFGAADASDCVRKALLAGEIAMLQQAVLELSGFTDDEDEAIDEVKN